MKSDAGLDRRVRDESRYRILRVLQENPQKTQRQIAAELNMSLGKVNYCLAALIDRGLVKIGNFRRSDNKAAYAYILTPNGIKEKAKVTLRFLRARMREYDALALEIKRLSAEVKASREADDDGA